MQALVTHCVDGIDIDIYCDNTLTAKVIVNTSNGVCSVFTGGRMNIVSGDAVDTIIAHFAENVGVVHTDEWLLALLCSLFQS